MTDSQLCVDTINSWAADWERNGWMRRRGVIKNLDLVQELYRRLVSGGRPRCPDGTSCVKIPPAGSHPGRRMGRRGRSALRGLDEWSDLAQVRSGRSQFLPAGQGFGAAPARRAGRGARAGAELRRGETHLRKWKARNTNSASRADGVTRPFRRPFGARECNPARRGGATSMSPTCTVMSRAANAKRPTEAGKLTRTALLENKSKSSPRRATRPETLLEMRRGSLRKGSPSRERRRASDGRGERTFRHSFFQRRRAGEIRAMGDETMETHARVVAPCSRATAATSARPSELGVEISLKMRLRIGLYIGMLETAQLEVTLLEPLGHGRRSYEQGWSDKSSMAPRASNASSQQSPHARPRITRAAIEHAGITHGRISPIRVSRINAAAEAWPPRNRLRVKGLGDKLGYLRASFVLPLTFLHQP
jgi:hypothetical protein